MMDCTDFRCAFEDGEVKVIGDEPTPNMIRNLSEALLQSEGGARQREGDAGFPTLEDTQERLAVDTPTADLNRSSRDNSVRNSIAITEMEGGQPSAYCREQLGLFPDGNISITEMRDRVVLNASR
jgi:Antitoxin VbhA